MLWKTLNQIMNKHEKNRSLPKEFTANNSANKFNEYFVNVGPNIAKKLQKSDRTYNQYLTGSYKDNFFLAL